METHNLVEGIQPSDIWSPEALRIDQSVQNTGAAKKLLTTIPVRKPNKQDFVRVNPDPVYRLVVGLIELKENRETFLLLPTVSRELSESEFFLAPVCILAGCGNSSPRLGAQRFG